MMSWWGGRKEEGDHPESNAASSATAAGTQAASAKKSKRVAALGSHHRRRLGGGGGAAVMGVVVGRGTPGRGSHPSQHDDFTATGTTTTSSPSPAVLVNETGTGIEVSVSDEVRSASSSRGNASGRHDDHDNINSFFSEDDDRHFWGGGGGNIPSVRSQLAARRKVHRAQFRTTTSTTLEGSHLASSPPPPSRANAALPPPSTAAADGVTSLYFGDRVGGPTLGRHRVPLFWKQQAVRAPTTTTTLRYQDTLFALRSLDPLREEKRFVRDEMEALDREIQALEGDRAILVQQLQHQQQQQKQQHTVVASAASASATSAVPSATTAPSSRSPLPLWDLYKLLASSSSSDRPSQGSAITAAVGLPASDFTDRSVWQERRGLCLTAALHNVSAREALLSKCGSTASALRAATTTNPSDVVVRIGPDTCRDGGAAATIQHISLLSGLTQTESGGFFLSRDASSKGKSYYWGHLPDRLFRRMKNAGMDPRRHACDHLAYLSTGPLGSYYAEFRSGERWWGSPAEGADDFHNLCSEWDITRAVFGPASTLYDAHGQHIVTTTSWILLGRDGRAAWKNLPARLHRKLERRLASETAPAEVSLGGCGSYFVRFWDGSTDYCLPAHAANACRKLESEGRTLTSIALHPDLPHDFIVRHT